MKERIHWIDLAKGFAIILVVVGHVVSSYHEAGMFLDNHLFNFNYVAPIEKMFIFQFEIL